MKFFTSIAPNHYHEGRQLECVKSWPGEVYSINNDAECELLKPQYPTVNFIHTTDTHEEKFGKPYVGLNAILNAMRDNGGGVLINSDIEISPDPLRWNECVKAFEDKSKLLYLHRYDYDTEKYRGDIYKDGIDVFFLDMVHLNALPNTQYCLGHCYFDLLIPYYLMCKGFTAATTNLPIAFHKKHPAQYKPEHWDYFGQYTGRTFMGSAQKSGKISERMYKFIRGNTVSI